MLHNNTTPRYPLFTPNARNFAQIVPDTTPESPLVPSDIDLAYSLNTSHTDGTGITVAVIGAFYSTTISDDFKKFGQFFNLPEKNLEVYYTNGSGVESIENDSWSLEAHADTQWVYASAPAARIICVMANDARIESLFAAVDMAVDLGADVISMSWGSPEFLSQAEYTERMKSSGRIFVASAGDTGGEVLFPSSSDAVVSVGGTVLHRLNSGTVFARSAWINGGGGPSRFTPIPQWQRRFDGIEALVGNYRATPDVALNAGISPGYYVFYNGRLVSVGGTSVSAPVFAGICARILQKNPLLTKEMSIMQYLYLKAGETKYSEPQYYFSDVTVGSNGRYIATQGFDLCTGLGAPVGNLLING